MALWSRVRGLTAEALTAAFENGSLVVGTAPRGTLHVMSAREHRQYARATQVDATEKVGAAARLWAGSKPRSGEEIAAWAEASIAAGELVLDEADLNLQRTYKWRPLLRSLSSGEFVRVPTDGRWGGSRPPSLYTASPTRTPMAPAAGLQAAVRGHLRAFGPATAEDAAAWLGAPAPAVRDALTGLEPELVRLADDHGRPLFDLAQGPRPEEDAPAPVRFLPRFDSALLAYIPGNRGRILPDAYRELVYVRANLQVLATFLVDGLVAGLWSVEERRGEARLKIEPFARLDKRTRSELREEGERLLRFTHTAAKAHLVVAG